ncbi:MAG: hypothetical protein GY953_53860, partial [bacterium]|nr:hypothetical protein [bacterium]
MKPIRRRDILTGTSAGLLAVKARASSGSVRALYVRPSKKEAARELTSARLVAGKGVEGDHPAPETRQVTLLEKRCWDDACRDLGKQLDPAGRRANILVEGVSLASSLGRRIRVGKCLIEVVGETTPCGRMDQFHQGLREALKPDCRGGVFGRIL